jgi:hypothetical protein
MDEIDLQQLLRQADRGEINPQPMLPQWVHRRARIHRLRQTAAAALILATVGLFTWHGLPAHAPQSNPSLDLAKLDQEARLYAAIADREIAAQRLADATRKNQFAVTLEREAAAMIMVNQADWQQAHGGNAQAEYRRVTTLFADTRAGKLAQEKLNNG